VETAALTIYSRPWEDTIAGVTLFFRGIGPARGKDAFKVLEKFYGSPQTWDRPTPLSLFGKHCEWTFRSTAIALRWQRWDLVAEFAPRVNFKDPNEAEK
jgi:hypothetical protein